MGIFKQLFSLSILFLLLTTTAQAIDLSAGERPFCSSGEWNVSGNTYTCQNGGIEIQNQTVTADEPFLLFANNGISVVSSTVEGDLEAQNGSISISSNSFIQGNATANGDIEIENSRVTGNVFSRNNEVNVRASRVDGNVEAPNGLINIADTQIGGSLIGQNQDASVEDSTVSGDIATSNGNINIANSDVFGDIFTQNGRLDIDDNSNAYATCTPSHPRCGATPPPTSQCQTVWPQDQTSEYSSPGQPGTNPFTVPSGANVETSLPEASSGVVTLQPVDYVIDSNSFANNTLPFARYQTSGTTSRVFIQGDVNLDYQQQGNNPLYLNFTANNESASGPAENLMFIVIGTLNIDRRVRISGYVFATEGVNFSGAPGGGNQVVLDGSVTSSGAIDRGQSDIVQTYIPPPPGFESGSFCEEVVNPPQNEVNHFRLTLPTELISCYAADILIRACLDENCDYPLSGSASATLQASHTNAEWSGSSLIGSDGQGNADIQLMDGIGFVQLSLVEGGLVEYTKQGSSPPTTSDEGFRCFNGNTRVPCSTDFKTAGLAYFDSDGQNPVQNQTSGTNFPTVLRAIETNTLTGACEARVEGTQSVQLGYECRNPGSCIAGQGYEFNGASVANAGTGVVSETIELTFDDSGRAPLNNAYSDAGEIRLIASLDLPAEPRGDVTDPAVTLSGISNPFVVKPAQLIISAPENTDVNQNGTGFVAAGGSFQLSIQALNANDGSTPNFGNETSPATVSALFDSVTYPVGGIGNDGFLTTGDFTKPDVQQAVFQSATASWNEAGIITLRAELVDNNYLGAGDIPSTPVSAPIGRFFPKEFVLVGSEVVDACNMSFSYLSEDSIEVSYELNAVNANGEVTRNYNASVYTGTASIAIASGSSEIDDSRVVATNAQNWEEGILSILQEDVAVMRALSGASAHGEGPYPSVQLALTVDEALDPTQFTNGERELLSGNLNLRFGRLVLADIFGPEDEDLRIEAQVEYWDGNRFVRNEDDNCFAMQAANVTNLQGLDGFQAPDVEPDDGTMITLTSGSTPFASLFFATPGAEEVGELRFSYNAPPWLQYDWDENGAFNQIPSAIATFGQYRGNDRIIFWLERGL